MTRMPSMAAAVMSIMLIGCVGEEKDESPRTVKRQSESIDPPVIYEIYDSECQDSEAPFELSQTAVWGWQGFAITDKLEDLEGVRSLESLESEAIERTSYGRLYARQCENLDASGRCVDDSGEYVGYKRSSSEPDLRACKDEFTYPRQSAEAVGLTALHYIDEASRALAESTGVELATLRLEIFPRFQSTTVVSEEKERVTWTTDNAAYFPGHNTIAVFPQSQSSHANSSDRLWESAFVMAHEFGHHIEDHYIGDYLSDLGLHWSGREHSYVAQFSGQAAEQSQMWTAIAEGFADVAAYYSNGGDISSLENVSCLGRNRNMTAYYFGDGQTPKLLTEEVVDDLLHAFTNISYCDRPNFNDPHTVGAILAYGLVEILNFDFGQELTDEIDKELQPVRMRILIDWLKGLADYERSNPGRELTPQSLFAGIATSLEKAIDIHLELSKVQRNYVCRSTKKLWPVLETHSFDSDCK